MSFKTESGIEWTYEGETHLVAHPVPGSTLEIVFDTDVDDWCCEITILGRMSRREFVKERKTAIKWCETEWREMWAESKNS